MQRTQNQHSKSRSAASRHQLGKTRVRMDGITTPSRLRGFTKTGKTAGSGPAHSGEMICRLSAKSLPSFKLN